MEIIYYPSEEETRKAMELDDPLLILVSYDGERMIASQIDKAVEHHILLKKAGFPDTDIDKYFRLVADKSGADRTFVCPENYSNVTRKDKRIEGFFKDGIRRLSYAARKLYCHRLHNFRCYTLFQHSVHYSQKHTGRDQTCKIPKRKEACRRLRSHNRYRNMVRFIVRKALFGM